jgi:hypothetical protein
MNDASRVPFDASTVVDADELSEFLGLEADDGQVARASGRGTTQRWSCFRGRTRLLSPPSLGAPVLPRSSLKPSRGAFFYLTRLYGATAHMPEQNDREELHGERLR